jgi:hypothetical protein
MRRANQWYVAIIAQASLPQGIARGFGGLPRSRFHIVMAGLVPAIHDRFGTKNVDARDKPGHDGET